MLRTKASTYAILATVEIARRQAGRENHGGVQAGEIARCLHLPAAYAAKVLTQLARVNVLHSDRGPRGGFRLSRDPRTIDLLEVVEAVDGAVDAAVSLPEELRESESSLQNVDRVFTEIVGQIRDALRSRTIAELMPGEPATAQRVQPTGIDPGH